MPMQTVGVGAAALFGMGSALLMAGQMV